MKINEMVRDMLASEALAAWLAQEEGPPKCPTCGGMMSGDVFDLVCKPPPPGFIPEPGEWSAGCGTRLVLDNAGNYVKEN